MTIARTPRRAAPPGTPKPVRLTPAELQSGLNSAPALLESAARKAQRWSKYKAGKVPEADTRKVLGRLSEAARKEVRGLTQRHIEGQIDRQTWYDRKRETLVAYHHAAGMAALGRPTLDAAAQADVRANLVTQVSHLDGLRKALSAKNRPSPAQVLARSDMYGAAVYPSGLNVHQGQMARDGWTEYSAVLGSDRNCGTCLDRASQGWVTIGTLRPLGDSPCGGRCRCRLDYRGKGRRDILPAFVLGDDGEFHKVVKTKEPKAPKEPKAVAPPKAPAVPKIATPPKPAPPPPAREGGGTGRLEDLRKVLDAHPRVGPERNEAITRWIDQNRSGAVSEVKLHGMVNAEAMHSIRLTGTLANGVKVDGITWHFPADATADNHPLGKTLNILSQTFTEKEFPESLTKHTQGVYFTRQTSDMTAYWRQKYGTTGNVAATGGDGHIVVYGGGPIEPRQLAHEMGHNLAVGKYGSITPPATSDFARAAASGEAPPTPYAKNNLAEDFAESVGDYAAGGRKLLQKNAPGRYEAIQKLLEEDAAATVPSSKRAASTPRTERTPEVRRSAEPPNRDTKQPAYRGQAKYLAEEYEATVKTLAAEVGVKPDRYRAAMTARLQETVDAGEFYVRTHADVLPKILADGRVKSQFETGTSSGALAVDFRRKVESSVLGSRTDLAAAERPIYGYLSTPNHASVNIPAQEARLAPYGDAVVT